MNKEDILTITYNFCETDEPILGVYRKCASGRFSAVKIFCGNEAIEMYGRLTGNNEH